MSLNELKPDDVMRALEEFASLNNCNNMRYLEGCGHFCKVLREPIDDMAGGRSPKCNEHCEHYSPPRDEEVFRVALSLLKKYQSENAEKDAEIKGLIDGWSKDQDRFEQVCAKKDAEIERLTKRLEKEAKCQYDLCGQIVDLKAEIERLKAHNKELDNLCDLMHQKLDEGYAEFANEERAEAFTQFEERLLRFYDKLGGKTASGSVTYHIRQIANELRGGAE